MCGGGLCGEGGQPRGRPASGGGQGWPPRAPLSPRGRPARLRGEVRRLGKVKYVSQCCRAWPSCPPGAV